MDDRERVRWRWRRWMYRAGLAVWFSALAFYFGPHLIMFGKLTGLTPADFVAEIQKFGVPEVTAIKEYQRDHGHLPDDLSELEPDSLPKKRAFYFHSVVRDGQYEYYGTYHQRITYNLDGSDEHWEVNGSLAHGRLPLPPVVISPTSRPASQPKP